jgi:hypothetical protein
VQVHTRRQGVGPILERLGEQAHRARRRQASAGLYPASPCSVAMNHRGRDSTTATAAAPDLADVLPSVTAAFSSPIGARKQRVSNPL